MTPHAAADLIEAYIARLRAELAAVGAAGADDVVAEVRSMLIDAAGDDADRADSEIASLGEPADLAAGILAERGLSPDGGISTADWWRMGIAVPIDIVIGVSVPLAALVVLYVTLAASAQPFSPMVAALGALSVAALAWPWLIWRPWRTGGSRVSPGMTITGLTVVRAPGFWRVVRVDDLSGLGLTRPRKPLLATVAAVLITLLIAGSAVWFGLDFVFHFSIPGRAVRWSGDDARQREAVTHAVGLLYGAVVDGDFPAARVYVTDKAALPTGGLTLLETRASTDDPVSYGINDPVKVRDGLWTVEVSTQGQSGETYVDTVTVASCLIVIEDGYQTRWLITDVVGPESCVAPT